MPNTKSAKKRLRQNEDQRLRNRSKKSNLRGQLRKVYEALDSGEVETAEKEFQLATKKLDQAGAKNVIHPNKAARHKSRIQKKLRLAKQSGETA